MRRIIKKNNKTGFTLMEMMLALAIILMISGLTVILIVSIKKSFMQVYNQNDAADYAMLYGRTFEQSFLGKVVNETTEKKYDYAVKKSGGSYKLTCNNASVIDFKQSKTQDGTKDKWEVKMGFYWDSSSNTVWYRVYMWDNYYNPGQLAYIYTNNVFLPHFSDAIGSITVSDSAVLSSGQTGYTGDTTDNIGDSHFKQAIRFEPATT